MMMKRIVFAMGLLPFAACVVDSSDDDDGSANTEGVDTENPSTTNPSTTNPSTTTDDTDSATSDDPTSSESGSSESGEPGGLGQCDTVCSTYMDCCEAQGVTPENCMDGGYGGHACEDTECFVLGCADDQECIDFGGTDAWVCNDDGACIVGCETIEDCDMVTPDYYDACDPDLGCIVEPEPFDCNETPCVEGYVCDTDSGACVECLEDGDCAENAYGPYCDTELNLCACMTTDDCAFELDECEI
jgi:hypothetical protein